MVTKALYQQEKYTCHDSNKKGYLVPEKKSQIKISTNYVLYICHCIVKSNIIKHITKLKHYGICADMMTMIENTHKDRMLKNKIVK